MGPSESMAPTLGCPFFLDLSRADDVEKKRAEREGRIEEFWRRKEEEGEKLGTKLLEMEANRPPAICNFNWHLTENLAIY